MITINNTPIEVMAPVGSYESLMAAIHAGADSVYFGIGALNMRSRSSVNFDASDLQKIVQVCEENNLKSYLTVNVVVYNNEIEEMYELLDLAKEYKVTAIIASDFAVLEYDKKIVLEIHISKQCNITNIEAVRFPAMQM